MFEHASSAPSNTDTIAGQAHRVIPTELTLPPPALLWEWLSYIYQTTGEWWRPPAKSPNPTAKALSIAPNSTALFSIKDFQNYSKQTQSASLTEKALKNPSAKNTAARTGFNYQTSRYFEEAGRLIEPAVKLENEADCRLVLSFIIAWSRFPLFENLPVNGASWMALSFARGACELKMRASKFKACLDELEKAGLLRLAGLSDGFLSASNLTELQTRRSGLTGEAADCWNAHFFQKHTTLYILLVTLSATLPTFNPFGETLTSTGMASKFGLDTSTNPERLTGSFPFDSCRNESNNNDNNEIDNLRTNEAGRSEIASTVAGFGKSDKLETTVQKLNTQEMSIYEFITMEANFEGYSRLEDKRETLDRREALKFATNGQYNLEQVRTRYEQVKEVWASQSGCRNPLALLHWTLTQDVDPRRGKLNSYKQPHTDNPVTRPKSYEANKSTPKNYSRPQLSFQKRMFPQSQPELSNPSSNPSKEASDFNQSSPAIFAPSSEAREPGKLWKVICEDLAGRFQLAPVKQALLKDSALHFKAENNTQVEIVLRSIWEERQLDSLTRNIINLALRQRLGPGLEVSFLSA